ncbi:MAG: DUF1501 domain-containing protein [Candidatus Sumerlaeia bacterium]|nr:DUF1501 domain-containing protein [Candidatus Sumerlaeia bacterium]
MSLSRRRFMQLGLSSLAYFSTAATTPNWIVRTAHAMQADCFSSDKILVILQQSGGNDGLNTVIPRSDAIYYDAATRPTIRVPQGSEIALDGLNGLHPRLANLANWYQQGRLAVVHNVGYLNPNFSHFVATDYYEYGYTPDLVKPTSGWMARFYDNHCQGAPDPDALLMCGCGISNVPDSMNGSTRYTPPAVRSASSYSFATASDRDLRLAAINALNAPGTVDPNLEFIQRSVNVAEASTADIANAASLPALVPDGSYPAGSLGDGLKLVSQIIRGGFGTRVFYVSQGGYDTHANQIQTGDPLVFGDHPELLRDLDAGLHAFLTEMELSGNLDRVVVMTFSEFGRRVKENGSRGTDHGAANCMFVLGGGVQGGVYGGQPNLDPSSLVNGSLAHAIDFRSVYAKFMQDWFNGDPVGAFGQQVYDSVIAGELPQLGFLRSTAAGARSWQSYQ